jgi:hypothetical protein
MAIGRITTTPPSNEVFRKLLSLFITAPVTKPFALEKRSYRSIYCCRSAF